MFELAIARNVPCDVLCQAVLIIYDRIVLVSRCGSDAVCHDALDGCPADRPPAQARALTASTGRGDDIRRLVRLPGSVRPLATQL